MYYNFVSGKMRQFNDTDKFETQQYRLGNRYN
jgi:hypothetical protein